VQHGLPRDKRLDGSGKQSILGSCSTQCMWYSVYGVLGIELSSWHGEIERDDLSSCS
jgi:hypothetical protein